MNPKAWLNAFIKLIYPNTEDYSWEEILIVLIMLGVVIFFLIISR